MCVRPIISNSAKNLRKLRTTNLFFASSAAVCDPGLHLWFSNNFFDIRSPAKCLQNAVFRINCEWEKDITANQQKLNIDNQYLLITAMAKATNYN